MTEIGVRELKIHASEIIRKLRDHRARYLVTYRGKPVGMLLPLDEAEPRSPLSDDRPSASAWEELTRLGEQIAQNWEVPQTTTEILSQMRR